MPENEKVNIDVVLYIFMKLWNCRDKCGYMTRRVTLIGPDPTRSTRQSDLLVSRFWYWNLFFNLTFLEKGRGHLGEGRSQLRSGKGKEKETEAKIWSEGKQKGDEDPTLTQRQNGLLQNSGDNGSGILTFLSVGSIFDTFHFRARLLIHHNIRTVFKKVCLSKVSLKIITTQHFHLSPFPMEFSNILRVPQNVWVPFSIKPINVIKSSHFPFKW